MLLTTGHVFHLRLNSSDLRGAKVAILPGDPARVEKISLLMKNPVHLVTHREFVVWYAEVDEHAVVICSTGIGGPSTSIVVEELSQLGVRVFFRVGTTGAIQEHINIGDLLIIEGAVRYDGASCHFAPIEFPAVSDFYCNTALVKAVEQLGMKYHIGVTMSSDTFYPGQERIDTYSQRVIRYLRGSMEEWKNIAVMSYEMESSTLLTMCKTQGLHAGVVLGVIVNRFQKETPNISVISGVESCAILTVLEAVRYFYNSYSHLLITS
ncbi:uridine phosphorylase [Blochmannia endosymbiont of Polyrhachis (Hedomyrma) turneri]|uniref:uridine phosphorylase n=1 Tax=Blochmannia endosymbiont of Polyrhachis (Hedomyrma) turneri TaxID=1505596 RepID=UPI00061A7A73|nr:uridine phosphorylase [Blochmannia endosymbiont of Polyrhachis (Hedomyrma) turneri]AKC60179.1 uridine phosphorylase [Blochmannia endosymbiont of Polyrhachis (Hedomyrma) turneri]